MPIAAALLVTRVVEVLGTGYLVWSIYDQTQVEEQIAQNPDVQGCLESGSDEPLSAASKNYYLAQLENWKKAAEKSLSGSSMALNSVLLTIKNLGALITSGIDEETGEPVGLCFVKVGFLVIDRQIAAVSSPGSQPFWISPNEETDPEAPKTSGIPAPLMAPLLVGAAALVLFLAWRTL